MMQSADERTAFSELQDMPTILPCGSCVEVDRWEDATDGEGAGSAYRTQVISS